MQDILDLNHKNGPFKKVLTQVLNIIRKWPLLFDLHNTYLKYCYPHFTERKSTYRSEEIDLRFWITLDFREWTINLVVLLLSQYSASRRYCIDTFSPSIYTFVKSRPCEVTVVDGTDRDSTEVAWGPVTHTNMWAVENWSWRLRQDKLVFLRNPGQSGTKPEDSGDSFKKFKSKEDRTTFIR